tara:strand:- start:371 stop:553 length:183 start_codon:yes stop_codon:yes gene_type:complete
MKKKKNLDNLSLSLKKNLELRKKQIYERDDKNIIGKRTNKIGISRLNLEINKNQFKYNNE